MSPLPVVVAGAAAGVLFAAWAGPPDRPRGRRIAAAGLVVAALVYVAFAVARGAGPRALLVDLAGVTIFGAVAAAGARMRPALLGFGWIVHAAWDVALHSAGHVPGWYPPLCVGFDLVVGAAVLFAARSGLVRRAR